MTDIKFHAWHVGRGWSGHGVEDGCPCPQEACGLVDQAKFHPDCQQHTMEKTTRQGHPADQCPGTSAAKEEGAA